MRQVLSIVIDDQIGALSRIIELFSSRGYNIDSICSGTCEEKGVHRLTLVCDTDAERIQKIIRLLEQIIFVFEVTLINRHVGVSSELLLGRISLRKENRIELLTLLNAYHAKIIEMRSDTVSFEKTGTSQELNSMITVLSDFEIIELARTGEASIHRFSPQGTENIL